MNQRKGNKEKKLKVLGVMLLLSLTVFATGCEKSEVDKCKDRWKSSINSVGGSYNHQDLVEIDKICRK